MIRTGVRKLRQAGIHFVCNILGEPGLPALIKAEDPDAIVCYRVAVFGTHDGDPENRGQWISGRDWLAARWNEVAPLKPHVNYFVMANEWGSNVASLDFVKHFVKFYSELIDACRERGIKCTICDFASGHPGWPTIPNEAQWLEQLDPLFRKAQDHGFPIGWHTYDLLDEHGNRMPREITITRFRAYMQNYPNLVIIGTEGGNATKDGTPDDGMFRGDGKQPRTSRQYMQEHYALVKDDRQLLSICWWELNNPDRHHAPEANWALDEWSSIFPWYIDWLTAV